jgi:hypothetical protein
MTKTQAHAILDKCKESYVSLAETNQALERTGDLCRASSPTLRFDGHEPSDYRPRSVYVKSAEVGFSYSRYLNCSTTESIK